MFLPFAEYEIYVTSALCVLALLGMGTTLTGQAFRGVARRPRCLVLILVSQLVVGPLLAVGLSRFFHLSTGIALGMLLVTALPGGLFSNIFALLSKASIALSVSATAVCTLGALVTTTLVLKVFGGGHLPGHFEMPAGRILFDITVNLLLPLLAGMALRRHFPKQAGRIGRLSVRGAMVLLVFYIVASLQSGRIDLTAYGLPTQLSIVLLVVIQSYVCGVLSWVFRLTTVERITSQIEVVVRNVHLGLLLNASLFSVMATDHDGIRSGVLFVLLYYGAASIVTGLAIAGVRRLDLHVLGERHPAPPPLELAGW